MPSWVDVRVYSCSHYSNGIFVCLTDPQYCYVLMCTSGFFFLNELLRSFGTVASLYNVIYKVNLKLPGYLQINLSVAGLLPVTAFSPLIYSITSALACNSFEGSSLTTSKFMSSFSVFTT